MKAFPSLSSRVWLLVALAAVPMFVYFVVDFRDRRAEAIAQVERDFEDRIRSALVEETYLVSHTRELLRIMASAPVMKQIDPVACSEFARRLLQSQADYLNFGSVLPDGTLFCSGLPLTRSFNLSTQEWFKEVVASRQFSRGHFIVSQVAGKQGLIFALPLLDEHARLRALVYSNTGLAWLERLAFANQLPAGWEAVITGPDGRAVFQQPHREEPGLAEAPLAAFLQTHPARGMHELPGRDGEPWLFGIAPLESSGGAFHIAIGAPKKMVLAGVERDFYRHLALLFVVALLSVLIGRLAINRVFVRWAEQLHRNLGRFGNGDREFRFPETSPIRELREIEMALNALVDNVKSTDQALGKAREHLGMALAGAGLGTWSWNLRDGTIAGNARWGEMLGYDPTETLQFANSWEDWVCPADLTAVQAAMESHFSGAKEVFGCEFRGRHKDGHWVWLLIHGRVVEREVNGRPLRMAGTALDISGRKATEHELRQRTEELAALLEGSPVPIWIARDPECREIVGNRVANEIFDVEPGENTVCALAVPAHEGIRIFTADDRKCEIEDLPMQLAAREARAVYGGEFRILLMDGRSLWLFGNAQPLFDEQGRARGAIGAFIDITRFKVAEEDLRQGEMLLTRAGQLAHLGAWSIELLDPDAPLANPVRWSDEMFSLLGYSPEEVKPSIQLYLDRIHPDDRQRVRAEARLAQAERRSFTQEYRLIRVDGEERLVLERADFLYDAGGRPTHCFGSIQDITEHRRVELEVARHRDQLETLVAERTYELAVAKEVAERANRTKSQFLANISHELRTPLNSLMLLAHVLTDNGWGNLSPQQVEYARMIELSGNDLLHLIDELLDLARIEAGRLDVMVKSVPFPDIMQNARRTHRHVAQQKGLEFKMEIGADVPPAILTDPLRLQQLLRNLIANAIKFTYAGSVTLRIRRAVSGWRYGNPALASADVVVAFDVIDTGVGVTGEQQEEIREAFERINAGSTREYTGSGLGLAISSEIAALLGGELTLTSVPRQGSTFTLFLPLTYLCSAKASVPLLEGPREAGPESAPASAGGDPVLAGKTVLVVDDDQRNRYALTAMLEKQGMRVRTVASGAEALDFLAREEVDIVLMDIMMPVMDGYQATRAIRGELGRSRLPVIALTANAMRGTREECLAAGCSDYLAKPVTFGDLFAMLHEWLAAAPGAEPDKLAEKA